ncbi:hypothetical protein IMZ48_31730, partial [Candidatus Bathyarchaeota archaeon]|nr:hypothetical protein [Candidatus Bathyarchaeota archaeon]
MPAHPNNPNATPTPTDVASPSTGHSTPTDRRRRRVDSGSATTHASAPSAKRPRTNEPLQLPPRPPTSAAAAWNTGAMLGMQTGPVAGRPAAKKLVIKNRRVDSPGQKAEVARYFDTTWREVEVAVQAVLGGKSVPMPLDRVYRGVEDLCRNGMEKDVYERLRKACERHLSG